MFDGRRVRVVLIQTQRMTHSVPCVAVKVAAADADVDRSNAARQSEGQRMLEAIKERTSEYTAQQVSSCTRHS